VKDMLCRKCGSSMIKNFSAGDGWIEPYEENWICPECGNEFYDNQAYGSEWKYKEEEEND
jgi:DNA-directed RNA polymerase subunit M/transcription elongation factor TFIIS